MPPRPRPRPRPRLTPSSPTNPEPLGNGARLKQLQNEEDDEDVLFIRNRGRSLKEVNKRAAQAAAMAPQVSSPTGSGNEDIEDEEQTPKHRLGKNRKQNTQNKPNMLPKWAKKGGILEVFATSNVLGESDSESENNDPSVYDGSPSKRRRPGTASTTGTPTGRRGKRVRSRSRSRSLTPPPDLTFAQKYSAQQAIQNALMRENMLPLASSAVIVVEDDDDRDDMGRTELDPALRHIAEAVLRERTSKLQGRNEIGGTQAEHPGISRHGSSGSAPTNVNIRVKWVPHPEDEVMQGRPQPTWSFNVERHHSMKGLLLQISDKAHVLTEDLVLMRDGKQVFTSVSADGLGVWDRLDLEACDRTTLEALRARLFRSPTPSQSHVDELESDRESSAVPSEASTNAEDVENNKLKLVLRSRGSREVTLSVRPTTTCGKIVRAFLVVISKHGGAVPASPRKVAQIRLCIDGERQSPDTPIADCDLEDGDMVEVVGM